MMMLRYVIFILISLQYTSLSIEVESSKQQCGNTALENQDCMQIVKEQNHENMDESKGYLMGIVGLGNSTISPPNEIVIYSFISALLVGLAGIFPLIMIPNADEVRKNSTTLNRLLSFAVGGLLGDVFLHLLPESWVMVLGSGEDLHWHAAKNGLWVLSGLIGFCILEKGFPGDTDSILEETVEKTAEKNHGNHNMNNNNSPLPNGQIHDFSAIGDGAKGKDGAVPENGPVIKTSGYLNLLANVIDNFTHGLAIGGSYLVSRWVGILTTAAILLHEIPHEIGDFAILLRAGFSRWKAAKYQFFTAFGGLLGAGFAHFVDSDASGGSVAWILPFTSGGFLYIALCSVVPDLMKEQVTLKESLLQLALMILGVVVMGLVGLLE